MKNSDAVKHKDIWTLWTKIKSSLLERNVLNSTFTMLKYLTTKSVVIKCKINNGKDNISPRSIPNLSGIVMLAICISLISHSLIHEKVSRYYKEKVVFNSWSILIILTAYMETN